MIPVLEIVLLNSNSKTLNSQWIKEPRGYWEIRYFHNDQLDSKRQTVVVSTYQPSSTMYHYHLPTIFTYVPQHLSDAWTTAAYLYKWCWTLPINLYKVEFIVSTLHTTWKRYPVYFSKAFVLDAHWIDKEVFQLLGILYGLVDYKHWDGV